MRWEQWRWVDRPVMPTALLRWRWVIAYELVVGLGYTFGPPKFSSSGSFQFVTAWAPIQTWGVVSLLVAALLVVNQKVGNLLGMLLGMAWTAAFLAAFLPFVGAGAGGWSAAPYASLPILVHYLGLVSAFDRRED